MHVHQCVLVILVYACILHFGSRTGSALLGQEMDEAENDRHQ